MAHSVCIGGQLYLIQLAEELHEKISSLKIIQLNTDGIMFSVDKSQSDSVREILKAWQTQTGFRLDDTFIKKVVQRDVNNYVMLTDDDKIKVKGGVVSDFGGGDFKHNSLSITCDAVVNYLLFDTPIEETIMSCDEPQKFQMIAKAGGSYDRVLHEVDGLLTKVNKVNRLYATKDERFGMVYKMKGESKNKIPNCPEHTIVDNSGKIGIDKLDKEWYIKLTQERVDKFLGRRKKKMATKKAAKNDEATEKVEVKEEISKVESKEVKEVKKEEKTPTFPEKMFSLGLDITELAGNFIQDGYNDNQSYEYVKASQYKTIFRQALVKNRLYHKIDDVMCQVNPDSLKSEKMVLTQYHATLTIKDVDGDGYETFMLWSQGADNLDKGLSKAKTLMIKDFIKSNFLVSDKEDDPEATVSDSPVKKSKVKFTSPADVKQAKSDVISTKNLASDKQKADIKLWIEGIRDKADDKTYGQKTLDNLETLTASKAEVALVKLEMRGNEYGLEL